MNGASLHPGDPACVRPERDGDAEAVAHVHTLAFERPGEARLVAALRSEARPYVGLVAERGGAVVGHVAFSPITILESSDRRLSMGLAPLAVLEDARRHGVGALLVRRGLDVCRALGAARVFVLGNPRYYERFGFRSGPARGLHYGSHELDHAFLVRDLDVSGERPVRGWVAYHRAFDDL